MSPAKAHEFGRKLVKAGKSPQEILDVMRSSGVARVIAVEWANEGYRRGVMEARREMFKAYDAGDWGAYYDARDRLIKTKATRVS